MTVVHAVDCPRPPVVVGYLVTRDGLLSLSTCTACGSQAVRHDRPVEDAESPACA